MGPRCSVSALDPWWQRKGCGEARFGADGRLRFTWPVDPDDPDGEPLDPFAAMGLRDASLGWELAFDGRVVQLLFAGGSGPQAKRPRGAAPEELAHRLRRRWGAWRTS